MFHYQKFCLYQFHISNHLDILKNLGLNLTDILGFIMNALALFRENPDPGEDEIIRRTKTTPAQGLFWIQTRPPVGLGIGLKPPDVLDLRAFCIGVAGSPAMVANNKRQTVFHFHMHLIPRYEGDNAGIAAWKQGTLEDAVKEQIIESVTAELKA